MKPVHEATFKKQLMKACARSGVLAYRKSGAWDAGAPEILGYRYPYFAAVEAKTASSHAALLSKASVAQKTQLKAAYERGARAVIAGKVTGGRIIAVIAWPGEPFFWTPYIFEDIYDFIKAVWVV